ncbi:hypothetical protein HKX48_002202 [Thoreauomyces humboldtii]|nr:hypothetical protein HKX48_002202 [Thoreauomyces humboldtii]
MHLNVLASTALVSVLLPLLGGPTVSAAPQPQPRPVVVGDWIPAPQPPPQGGDWLPPVDCDLEPPPCGDLVACQGDPVFRCHLSLPATIHITLGDGGGKTKDWPALPTPITAPWGPAAVVTPTPTVAATVTGLSKTLTRTSQATVGPMPMSKDSPASTGGMPSATSVSVPDVKAAAGPEMRLGAGFVVAAGVVGVLMVVA